MSTSDASYRKLAEHYRECLSRHGDSARGMDWPRERDAATRFAVMTEMFARDLRRGRRVEVLDFGCGTSRYYDYLGDCGLSRLVSFMGVDILKESITISRRKYPRNRYLCADILASRAPLGVHDYVTINGVFTQKRGMSEREMRDFLERALDRLYPACREGLAFNTMSGVVDYKRRGAFHVDASWAARLFARRWTRHFVVRHDYGLYEQTFYLFKKERPR